MSADISPAPSEPRRLTVLYVIWALQMGGAERVVADLARSLDRRLFRPIVCCLNFKGHLAEALEVEGIPVFALNKRPKLDPGVLPKLVRLMRRERVDVVHTHLWTASFWGRLAALGARTPVRVVTEHNLDTWRRRPHWLADRLLARATDRFIFVSDEVEAFYLRRLRLRPGTWRVVHNGVARVPPVDDPAGVRERMGLPGGAVVAGVVGRLEERKGHRFFVEAMRRVVAEVPRVAGLIVGDGVERERLEAQIAAAGIEGKLRLVGYWPELAEAYAALDLFVLPSLMEGHPLAILEAMTAGKPVVATDVGGNPEAVRPGETGVLVPPADPQALADAILGLVRDPARAARMGEDGRHFLERHFSLESAVRANQEIYLAAWEERPRGEA